MVEFVNAVFDSTLALARDYYAMPDHSCGGNLHVVMKLTYKARIVLAGVALCPNGTGGNHVAHLLGLNCGRLTGYRGGAYAARLAKEGWLSKRDEWYRGRNGSDVWMGVSYTITEKGRKALSVARGSSVPSVTPEEKQ